MRKSKVIATLFLLSLTGAFSVLGDTEDNAVPRQEISKYRSWLKVTPQPHPVKLTAADTVDGIASD